MRFNHLVSFLGWAGAYAVAQTQWPIRNDGLTTAVEWDHYSLIVNGQRLYIWSGEVHYWRIPVPELWIDVLQKVKAAGFNTVSFYGNWGFHSSSIDALDFESGAHDPSKLFTLAKEIGLYIIFRPGPYINAETTAGGFPGYVTTGEFGALRNNDTKYTAAWEPYMSRIGEIVAQHQVSNGGNVIMYQIENEYGNQWTNVAKKTPNLIAIAYMEKLEANARAAGINVPTSHNNPNLNTKSWSADYGAGVGGNTDLYAADSYPSCWSCDLNECGSVPDFTVVNNYMNNFNEVSPNQPPFLGEFQGGAYLPWSGPEGGCTNNTGPNWVNVFYRHNIAQRISLQNIYMVFGGTNWGGLPFPKVGTSYDYSAPIAESRVVADKYAETKLFGQFIRVARDLTKVDLIGNNTLYATDSTIYTSELRNPDTKAAFYVAIHASSPSTAYTPFGLHVSTSIGNITIPQNNASQIVLNGRESKMIVTDFAVGNEKLIYSTAEIFTVSVQDGKPIVFLWLPSGESGEFLLTGVKNGTWLKKDGCSGISLSTISAGVIASWTQGSGSCALQLANGYRFILMDRAAAYASWVPTTSVDPYTPESSTVIVQGPNLVRSVSLEGNIISILGDWLDTTALEVFSPRKISQVRFNGKEIHVKKSTYGSLVGTVTKNKESVTSVMEKLPALTQWKVADGLPERAGDYDDSKWTDANHNTTVSATKPATYPVLYADEYGYHTGNLLWRGRFAGSTATGVTLAVMGGLSHGWSAYLNGQLIGSYLGSTTVTTSILTLSFANATLSSNSTNVLFVIQDHMGHDETTGAVLPRGIYNATLIGTKQTFTSWKLAGNAGGEANIVPIQGPFNEGGLHAERMGWHLPALPASILSNWSTGASSVGLSEAGARFYRTVVELDLPKGYDISLGFVLGSPAGSTVRAQLYVNGYQFGKYVPYIGNQVVFPVYPGILDYHGSNTIALSIWTQSASGGSVTVDWTVLGVVASSFDPGFAGTDMSYLRPEYTDRSAYY